MNRIHHQSVAANIGAFCAVWGMTGWATNGQRVRNSVNDNKNCDGVFTFYTVGPGKDGLCHYIM